MGRFSSGEGKGYLSTRYRDQIERKIKDHNIKKKKLLMKSPKSAQLSSNIEPIKELLKDVKGNQIPMDINIEGVEIQQKPKNLQQLAASAEMKQFGLTELTTDKDGEKKIDDKHKTFYREFQKVIAAADVILEVVDARDPLGTRCPAVEQCVREAGDGKRLVLVLNKADLVPREILDKWLKYIRRSLPCIPFKSSTQSQNKKLGRRKLKSKIDIKSGSVCVGAEGLTSLLGNYTRNKGIKTSIRVGVVGIPNVGKSSLINSLKRSRACKVGAVPGVTRCLQEVQLDSKVKLLDSPGLAFASNADPHAALKNAVLSSDPIEPAEMIISRANKEHLIELYLVPDFKSPAEFLLVLARRFGKFKKGGIVDISAAAKLLVDDWNRGKILYHTEPPEDATNHEISSSIVTSEVAEFDLDSYDKQIFIGKEESMDTNSVSNENTESGNFVTTAKNRKSKKKSKEDEEKKKTDSLMQLEGNMRLNKLNKLKYKKMKKKKARNERTDKILAESIESITL